MDFPCIGSANQYAKRLARQTQWNLKKQSGDFTGHKKSLGDYVNVTKASSVLPQTDEADKKLSGIMTKAQAGKKLSPDEWEYLRAKHPVMYEQLREAEREQESYEKALKRCKTRDEAQRLHVSKLGEIMTAAKNGDSSALVRLNRLTRTMTAFMESKEYRDMPTEAEEAIARESERKAEQEALREEAERAKAERDAETVSKDEPETQSETVSGDETGTQSETVSGDETGTQSETVSGDETGAQSETVSNNESETESGTRSKDAIKSRAENVPERKIGRDAGKSVQTHVGAVSRHTDAASNAETSRAGNPRTRMTDGSKSTNRVGASVVAFGQRAYLNERDRKPIRKSFDAEA